MNARSSSAISREARLALEIRARDAVHRERALVDLALGIEVAVESAPGRTAIHELDAADLDDAVAQLGFEARGFGVEDDLSHGGASLPLDASASIASFASRSTRSLPGTPEWPCTQCHSISCALASSSSRSHRSWFFTGFVSAVRQPRAFQSLQPLVMPSRTYCESV